MLKLFKEAKLSPVRIISLLIFIGLQVAGTMILPRLTANIINYGVVLSDRDYVFRTGALMIGVAVLTGLFAILSTYYSAELTTRFAMITRKKLFKRTQDLSYQDFRHFNTSSLITRSTNDVEQIQSALSMFFEMIIPAPFIIVIGLVLSVNRDPYMALIILVAIAVMIIVFVVIGLKIFPAFIRIQKGLDKVNGFVSQYISGIRVVRAFNRTKLETKRMDEAFVSFAKINIRVNRLYATVMPLISFIMSMVMVAVIWFGAIRIEAGNTQIGDIMAVIEYSMNILMYLIMAVFAIIMIPRAQVCAQRISEVLNFTPEITDGDGHINPLEELSLKFDNVGFAYSDAENPVLQNISFTCQKGTTTAIIGSTGSGKTTLARLIPRLIDASSGEIRLNGTNVTQMSQEDIRNKVGFVPQKAYLFTGTIAENLRHGDRKATLRELRRAVQIAQSEEFINSKPGKYDTQVVQGGKNFSGGQRQRLAIARMLVKKPDIYVFDDSFSALDFKTDAALRKSLKEVTKEAIVINIAQRVTTIKEADQILVLDEGKIVGRGTHQELMASNEVYQEIARSQLSESELAVS